MVKVRFERQAAIVLFLGLVTLATSPAQAEVYKCRAADGRIQFSDTRCEASRKEETVPDRQPVSEAQMASAQMRSARMQVDSPVGDESASVLRIGDAPQVAERVAGVTKDDSSADADTISRCVRDVERQAASENVKAEMIAACRTSASQQRASGRSGDMVRECVRSVERTGASGNEKARQLALCHGGDVQPEYRRSMVRSSEPMVAPQRPTPCPEKCDSGKKQSCPSVERQRDLSDCL